MPAPFFGKRLRSGALVWQEEEGEQAAPEQAAPAQAAHAQAAPAPDTACAVDGACVPAGERVASKYYHFTMLEVTGNPGMKKPDDVGRQGFFEAIQRTYAHLYRDEAHPLHNGPAYGCVARELHARSSQEDRRKAHLHSPCAFPVEHKWKAVERHLREVEKIKVPSPEAPSWGARVQTS